MDRLRGQLMDREGEDPAREPVAGGDHVTSRSTDISSVGDVGGVAGADLVELLASAALATTQRTVTRDQLLSLYAVTRDDPVGVADMAGTLPALTARLRALLASGSVTEEALHRLGGWLLHAAHRGPARLGIAIVTALPDLREHLADVAVLGREESLTPDAVTALAQQPTSRVPVADIEAALFDVAQNTTGWGRIYAVEALCGRADPRIRTWLLTTGFRNDVMWEYTAHRVVVTNDLLGHLHALPPPGAPLTDPDRALLAGARDLLFTLLHPSGAGGDIRHYRDAAAAVEAWAQRVAGLPSGDIDVRDLRLAADIDRLLRLDSDLLREECGWSAHQRRRVVSLLELALHRSDAVDAVEAAVGGDDRSVDVAAHVVANRLGILLFDALFARARRNPTDPAAWAALADEAQWDDDVLRVVQAAEELLLPARRTRAPATPAPLRVDPEDTALDLLLQKLFPYRPECGDPLIEAALRSGDPGLRSRAVHVLETWPAPYSGDVIGLLEDIAVSAPDAGLRTQVVRLLERDASAADE